PRPAANATAGATPSAIVAIRISSLRCTFIAPPVGSTGRPKRRSPAGSLVCASPVDGFASLDPLLRVSAAKVSDYLQPDRDRACAGAELRACGEGPPECRGCAWAGLPSRLAAVP